MSVEKDSPRTGEAPDDDGHSGNEEPYAIFDEHAALEFIQELLEENSAELRKSEAVIQKLNETAKVVNMHIQKLESDLNEMRTELFESLAAAVEVEERLELVERVKELMNLIETLAEQRGTVKLMQSQIEERIQSHRDLQEREKTFHRKKKELVNMEKQNKCQMRNNLTKEAPDV